MSLADMLRPQGAAASPVSAVSPLAEGRVLAQVPGGLTVELAGQEGVSYGPLRWSPPLLHVHPAGTGSTGQQVNPSPVGKECLVAFVDGDPGLGWVLQVAW